MKSQSKQFFIIRERTYHRDLTCCTDYETRNLVTEDILRLRNINRKLDRINTDDCNGNPRRVIEYCNGKMFSYDVQDEKRAAKNEKTSTRLEKEAQKIASRWGFSIRIQGDPRGSAIKLDFIGADTDIIC